MLESLIHVKCGELVAHKQEVLTIDERESVAAGLKMMADNKVRGLVVRPEVKEDEGQEFVGVLDIVDILTAVFIGTAFVDFKARGEPTVQDLLKQVLEMDVKTMIGIGVEAKSGRWSNGIVIVDSETEIGDILTGIKEGLQRFLVKFGGGREYRVLSAFDVALFLTREASKLDSKKACSKISEAFGDRVKLGSGELVALDKHSTALEGFRKMIDERVSIVPILDEERALIATLSASDLRDSFTKNTNLEKVVLPVMEFIEDIAGKDSLISKRSVTVSPNNTLLQALQLCLHSRIHHIWVLDEETETIPKGCLSLSDLISSITQ